MRGSLWKRNEKDDTRLERIEEYMASISQASVDVERVEGGDMIISFCVCIFVCLLLPSTIFSFLISS